MDDEALWGDVTDDDFPEELDTANEDGNNNPPEIPLTKYRRGYLYVSDLTQQNWCEQQMLYSLTVPLEVPIEEPPHVTMGSTLHLARELEVQDIVTVPVSSREDSFAIKALNLLKAVRDLLLGVPVRREIPVFGIPVDCGVFFMGIIDELRCDQLTLDVSLLEFKTRTRKSLPGKAQKKIHNFQIMLYKCLLDNLVRNELTKETISYNLSLDLNKKFGKGLTDHLGEKRCHLDCLDKLLDELFSTMQSLPLVNELIIEYCCQENKETFHMEQVPYCSEWLSSEIKKLLLFWTGERKAVGVDIEDAWKCAMCDYADMCEWRLRKVREHLDGQKKS